MWNISLHKATCLAFVVDSHDPRKRPRPEQACLLTGVLFVPDFVGFLSCLKLAFSHLSTGFFRPKLRVTVQGRFLGFLIRKMY